MQAKEAQLEAAIVHEPDTNNAGAGSKEDEETVEIVGACKLMDGFFLGDAICAEVSIKIVSH